MITPCKVTIVSNSRLSFIQHGPGITPTSPFMVMVILLMIFVSFATQANDENLGDNWGDGWGDETQETVSPWQTGGFIEAAYGRFLQDNIVANETSLSEFRGRFEIDYSHEQFELSAKGELLYDDGLDDVLFNTRELTFAARALDNLDIKLGRQVLTWGAGDYLFLNDLFAKDWQSFFAGREDSYLKAPSDSLRLTGYSGDFTFDLAWTPQFTADNYLTGERFSFYSPAQQQIVAPAQPFKVNQGDSDQWAIRISTSKDSVEYALYGYHGLFNTPQGVDAQGIAYFPKLNSWGASLRMPLAKGLFSSEFSFYNSTQDPQGNNPAINNSQFRFLLGYEQELVKNLTISGQYYLEITRDYAALKANSSQPQAFVDEHRQLLTLRLRYTAMQQKLTWSLFTFYSPSDNDAYIRPSISYRKDDHWIFSAGANVFDGQDKFSFFGQHQDNSNGWLRVRYSF